MQEHRNIQVARRDGVLNAYHRLMSQAKQRYDDNPIARALIAKVARRVAEEELSDEDLAECVDQLRQIDEAFDSNPGSESVPPPRSTERLSTTTSSPQRPSALSPSGKDSTQTQEEPPIFVSVLAAIITVAILIGLLAALFMGTTRLLDVVPDLMNLIDGPKLASEITVVNHLFTPVDIYVNDQYRTQIGSQLSVTLAIEEFPVKLRYQVVRDIRESDNYAFGDPFSGVYERLGSPSTIEIDHAIGDIFSFFLVLNNFTDWTCEISINDNSVYERQPGIIGAHIEGVTIGYYEYHANYANVSLHCSDGCVHYWGIRPDSGLEGLSEQYDGLHRLVDENTGLLELSLHPDTGSCH